MLQIDQLRTRNRRRERYAQRNSPELPRTATGKNRRRLSPYSARSRRASSRDAIVAIPIAAVREYRIGIFGRVVLDPFHASPISGIGRIACTFVRGDFREHT